MSGRTAWSVIWAAMIWAATLLAAVVAARPAAGQLPAKNVPHDGYWPCFIAYYDGDFRPLCKTFARRPRADLPAWMDAGSIRSATTR